MSLPKIEYPTFDVKEPITNQPIKMRPMLVKEEKILLMAKQSAEKQDQLNAVKQIVNNCVIGELDIDQMPFITLEWLFLKLRAQSISNIVEVQYQISEDKTADYKINLDKVEFKAGDDISNVIKINDTVSITLKRPTVGTYTNEEFFALEQNELLDYILINSVASIVDGDSVFDTTLTNKKELVEFIDSIPAKSYKDIQKYFDSSPSLYYKLTIGEGDSKQDIELTTLDDFFTFV